MPARTPWGSAIAVGLLIASAATIPQAIDVARRTRQHVLVFEVQVSAPTVFEIYFDMGPGFRPAHSVQLPLSPTPEPVTQRVPLGPGAYWAIRVDPFAGVGTATVQRMHIEDRDGRTVAELTADGFEASAVQVTERAGDRLTAVALAGHTDPQLIYRYRWPLLLVWSIREFLYRVGLFYLFALGGTVAARLLPVPRPRARVSTADWTRHRATGVVCAAALATLGATYPLLLGRSLVTPNNGPTTFVYDRAPFVPGSSDMLVESGRAADTNSTMWVTLAYSRMQRDAVRAGEFPWWNRYAEGGVPLWGQGQTRLLDPVHWLSLIDNEALGADLAFIAGRFVFAVGTGLAAGVATGSWRAAAILATVAPFVGHFMARLNDPGYFSIVYAPWVLWAYGLLCRARDRGASAAASAWMALATALAMCASPPKEGVLTLAGAHAAGLAAMVAASAPARAGWAVAAIATAALITAPHWLIFLETLSNGLTVYDGSAIEFAGLSHLGSLVLGASTPFLPPAGVNLLVLAGLAVAVVEWRRLAGSPLAIGCCLVALMAVSLAIGVIPGMVLNQLPLVAQIHHVGRSTLIAVVPLLLVAASPGIAALWDAAGALTPRRATIAGVVTATIGIGAVFATTDFAVNPADAALVLAVWAGVWPSLCRGAGAHGSWLLWCAVAIVTAAVLLPGGLHVQTGRAWLDELLMQPRMRVALQARPPEFSVMTNDEPFRVVGAQRVLGGAVAAHLGLETVTGFEALASPGSRWMGGEFAPAFPSSMPLESAAPGQGIGPLLDLWGVRYQVAAPDSADGRPLLVHRRPGAWPRAFFVDRVETYDERRAFLDRLRRAEGPFAAVSREALPAVPVEAVGEGPPATVVPATAYRLTPNTTTFTVQAPVRGMVVLSEAYWPGVRATIDDRPARVVRVNETLRGVAIEEPGTHVIRFAYRPLRAGTAAVLAVGGGVVLVGLIVVATRSRSRQRPGV